MRKKMILFIVLLVSVFVPYKASADTDLTIKPITSSDWGDATLLKSGNSYLLMDVTFATTNDVLDFIVDENIKEFDLYLSHYHNDHIGSYTKLQIDGNDVSTLMEYLLLNNNKGLYKGYKYTIDTIYLPDPKICYSYNEKYDDKSSCQSRHEALVKAAEANSINVKLLSKGSTFKLGNTTAEVLFANDNLDIYDDGLVKTKNGFINNCSLVTMFTNGKIKFLTAGDIEQAVENKILQSGIDISADIFKLNHHGIQTTREISNTKEFVDAVKPKYSYFTFNLKNTLNYTYEDIEKSINNLSGFSNMYAANVNEDISFVIENDVITPIAEKNAYTVTINYIDKDSNEILHTKRADYSYNLFGRSVNYYLYDYAKTFDGYTLVDDLDENEISGVLSENATYNIYYQKNIKVENTEEKNPDTGINLGYGMMIVLVVMSSIAYILIRKKSKFLKHN